MKNKSYYRKLRDSYNEALTELDKVNKENEDLKDKLKSCDSQDIAVFPEQIRKIGTSFYIAIPQSWIKANKIKAHCKLNVIVVSNGSLKICMVKKARKPKK